MKKINYDTKQDRNFLKVMNLPLGTMRLSMARFPFLSVFGIFGVIILQLAKKIIWQSIAQDLINEK